MTFSSLAARMVLSRRFRTGLAGLALAATLAAGCDGAPGGRAGTEPGCGASPGAAQVVGQSAEGAINIAVLVPPNFQVATASYQITKPGFSLTGSLNVAQSATVSGVIGGIPVGTGYTLTLAMTDVAKKFTGCSGSSTFAVAGGTTTPVSVDIACHLPQSISVGPPAVPVPMPAVALLAVALLATGSFFAGRGRGRTGSDERES
jgi:hypothetical protein